MNPAGTQSRNEDRVVVYSAAEQQYCKGLLDGFTARHPGIAVEFVFGISTALHERFLAALALNRPAADVLWSSAMDLQMSLVHAGHALPHPSAEARALPPGAAYRDLAYATTVEPLLTLVNRDCFDTRHPAGTLAEIAVVLKRDLDRFRGRVACYDIGSNGLGFLALLHESQRAAEFGAFLEALSECRPKAFGSTPPLVDEVASGRAALAYHVLASYALRAVRSNPALAIAVSSAPSLAISRVALISRSAPHPNAARLFVDYLLSQDGQQRLREACLFPIRGNLNADDTPKQAVVNAIPIDRGLENLLDPQRRTGLLSRWRSAIVESHNHP